MSSAIRSALWGFIVGDALGVPHEFSTREMMKQRPAKDLEGYGTHDQPPGTWSDDTGMMMCVLEHVMAGGRSKDLAALFLKWYTKGYWTPHGSLFDIGITTRRAMHNLLEGMPPSQSGIKDKMAAGNGTLMRCLPYAFVDDIARSIFNMVRDNRITHRHHLGSWSCMYYVKMLRALLDGKTKQEAAAKAAGYLRMGWRITDSDDDHEELRVIYSRLFSDTFASCPESEISSSGYVISTLEATVWCFLTSNSYEEAVLKAVNLGGDTDTIAALTGGLAGLYYGYDSIPQKWIGQIARAEDIEHTIRSIVCKGPYICSPAES